MVNKVEICSIRFIDNIHLERNCQFCNITSIHWSAPLINVNYILTGICTISNAEQRHAEAELYIDPESGVISTI